LFIIGVKPVIQPIKVVPFKEKSSFHFVVLWLGGGYVSYQYFLVVALYAISC